MSATSSKVDVELPSSLPKELALVSPVVGFEGRVVEFDGASGCVGARLLGDGCKAKV